MNRTPIEWCDFTINPFRFRNLETGKVGHHCVKISPGCANCYSSAMQAGPYLSGLTFIAENKPKGEFFLDEGVLWQVLRRKKPCRVFWCDMTDMFLEDYPDEWIDRCFAVMAMTPHVTHQILTKRPKRMREYFDDPYRRDTVEDAGGMIHGVCYANTQAGWPLPNVLLGVSAEDQQHADDRRPHIAALAALGWQTFISYEPALGPVDWKGWEFLKWGIVGGESGRDARPFSIDWATQAVNQWVAVGISPFVKQLGTRPGYGRFDGWHDMDLTHSKGGDISEWPEDLRVREFPAEVSA